MRSAAALLLLVCAQMQAQTHQHNAAPEKSPVDLSKLPAPAEIAGVGHSHIAVTTKSAEAQRWFDQGLALMHCFWDYEALRAFEQAVRLDPDCAMCHWGVSRALSFRGGAENQVAEELAKAVSLGAKASDREQRYIRADSESAAKKGEEGARAYEHEMETLIDRYPDELEARLLYAGHLNRGYDEKGDPGAGTILGQAMLRDLLHEHPENAAANHYWIHAIEDSGHPELALESANKLAALTPGSGHMVHMPGHIYYKTGDYERARQAFLAAMRVDLDYMAKQRVAERDDWNYAHNISYLIAACAEQGRYAEAREHARALDGLANDPDRSGAPGFYVLQIGGTEMRLAIRYANWEYAAEHKLAFGVADDKVSVWARGYRDGSAAYARGMKAADSGQSAEAEAQSNLLEAYLWRMSQEDLAGQEKGARDRVLKLLGTSSLELRGNIAGVRGDMETARSLLDRAAEAEKRLGYSEPPQYSRPSLEVLGAVLLRAGKFDEAREAYRKALLQRPRSGFALYGIALTWDRQGDRAEAEKSYRDFLAAWALADPDLPQVQAAHAFLQTAR